jgi:hypothetical protein
VNRADGIKAPCDFERWLRAWSDRRSRVQKRAQEKDRPQVAEASPNYLVDRGRSVINCKHFSGPSNGSARGFIGRGKRSPENPQFGSVRACNSRPKRAEFALDFGDRRKVPPRHNCLPLENILRHTLSSPTRRRSRVALSCTEIDTSQVPRCPRDAAREVESRPPTRLRPGGSFARPCRAPPFSAPPVSSRPLLTQSPGARRTASFGSICATLPIPRHQL